MRRRAARWRRASRALSRRSTWTREVAVLALTLVVAGALVFALVRPQAMLTRRMPEYEQQDLVLMLDRSASMRAHDISPSRFSRATLEIQNFLKHKPEGIDRVGLVGFADSSLILSYLTRDLDTVSFYLDWIEHDPQTLLGTDIGAALKNAREVARKDDRPTRKLFLLVSDGEDYGGELSRQLAVFRSDGYRVHCIGIGSDEEVPVPIVNPDGQGSLPPRRRPGRSCGRGSRRPRCAQIATGTGGRYMRSTTGGELARGARRRRAGRADDPRLAHDDGISRPVSRRRSPWRPLAGAALWLLL